MSDADSSKELGKGDVVEEGIDPFLRTLVAIVEGLPIEFGVTLSVQGSVISGRLISAKEYFVHAGEWMKKGFQAQGAGEAAEGFEERFGMWGLLGTVKREDGTTTADSPYYIHLKEARYYVGSGPGIPLQDGLFWRGLLSSVDGFSLGEFVNITTA